MPLPRKLTRLQRGPLNAGALRWAGRGSLADLEHVGRRSGLVRHTPVRAFRVGDAVAIGLSFGPESDWLKNLQAAGQGRIRLGDQVLELGAPQVVPVAEGTAGMPRRVAFAVLHLLRAAQCVRLPVLGSAPAGHQGSG